jgi:hypothetical protein
MAAEFTQQILTLPDEEFPGTKIPTVFADGIVNVANSRYIVKFYFFRLDPGTKDVSKAQVVPCAQVVLPLDGFINTFAFLESAVEKLRAQGIITDQALAAARKASP